MRYVFGVCGAGLLLAVAAPMALAASDDAPSSGAAAKATTAPADHRSAQAARPRHAAKPAPHKAASHREHKKDFAVGATTAGHTGPADNSLDQRPLLGPFSFGVETEPKVKRRSIRGGEYDPERDGDQHKGYRPNFLGLSLKSPLSW